MVLVVEELELLVLAATKVAVVWPENSLVCPKPSVLASVMVVVAVMTLEPETPAGRVMVAWRPETSPATVSEPM